MTWWRPSSCSRLATTVRRGGVHHYDGEGYKHLQQVGHDRPREEADDDEQPQVGGAA